jgi:hypothetical protein
LSKLKGSNQKKGKEILSTREYERIIYLSRQIKFWARRKNIKEKIERENAYAFS